MCRCSSPGMGSWRAAERWWFLQGASIPPWACWAVERRLRLTFSLWVDDDLRTRSLLLPSKLWTLFPQSSTWWRWRLLQAVSRVQGSLKLKAPVFFYATCYYRLLICCKLRSPTHEPNAACLNTWAISFHSSSSFASSSRGGAWTHWYPSHPLLSPADQSGSPQARGQLWIQLVTTEETFLCNLIT